MCLRNETSPVKRPNVSQMDEPVGNGVVSCLPPTQSHANTASEGDSVTDTYWTERSDGPELAYVDQNGSMCYQATAKDHSGVSTRSLRNTVGLETCKFFYLDKQ